MEGREIAIEPETLPAHAEWVRRLARRSLRARVRRGETVRVVRPTHRAARPVPSGAMD